MKPQNLEELIASIDREIAVARPRGGSPPASRRRRPNRRSTRCEIPARLEPAVAFAQAKGLLQMPVTGAVTHDFGAPDAYGSASRGISIATRSQAQVTAPSDGWVVYAGPFRSYGQLLIPEPRRRISCIARRNGYDRGGPWSVRADG